MDGINLREWHSRSSLDSVVNIQTDWKLLDNHEPLAQLHAKYQGKSMADEEDVLGTAARMHSCVVPSQEGRFRFFSRVYCV